MATPRYVIIDVDVGCDDAWAILMLIKAEAEMNVKILAITCVAGNTTLDNVARNVARVLQCAQRSDIPVFKGASSALIKSFEHPPFHGNDGLGDLLVRDEPDMSVIKSENAVAALYRLANEHPKAITLVACGPLTNVALAIKTYNELSEKLRDIFVMGGNYMGVGNMPRSSAEFNFYTDSESAHIVLTDSQCPITILPWEACKRGQLKIPMEWRRKVLGIVEHAFVRFLNPIEQSIFDEDEPTWAPCDALVIACLLWPDRIIKRQKARHCTVELHGSHTRGQMVVNHDLSLGPANVTVVELLDAEACMRAFLWTVDAVAEF